jgi:two-component system, OmpR family, KDP operon response regulator KdpE
MSEDKILIVDDEQSIRRFLKVTLSAQGYTVIEAVSGQQAISLTSEQKPDVIILDLGLPDIDGVEVTKLLRQWTEVPIIILSVRGSESDKIAALDAGANDYLTKPFGVGELLARLRVALRDPWKNNQESVFSSGSLKVDLTRRLVTVSEREIQLTPKEYELLHAMINDAGKVLTHHHILCTVWGTEYGEEFHMLHVNISNLRRKIEPDPLHPQYVITEPGVGYRLKTG